GDIMSDISREDYVEALHAIKLSDLQKRILSAIYWCPHHKADAKTLAALLDLPNYGPINSRYGNIGNKIAHFLQIQDKVLISPKRNEPEWWSVMSTGAFEADAFYWTLRPNFVLALESVGLIDKPHALEEFFDIGETSLQLFEGKLRTVIANRYERNPVARKRCIEQYGAVCVVCNFNFAEAYGEIGAGYIHVHHLRPLS